jgi:hypothetical protein
MVVEQHPKRRVGDYGWVGRVLAWYRRWGLLITGLWLIGVSIAVLVVAVAFVDSQQATERNARVACVRSKEIGPWVIRDYADRRVLPPAVLAKYRELIPKTCD